MQSKSTCKVKNQKQQQEIDDLHSQISKLNRDHKAEMEKKQKSLESLSSQHKQVKGENTTLKRKVTKFENSKIELEGKIKQLTEENQTHLQFIRSTFYAPLSHRRIYKISCYM